MFLPKDEYAFILERMPVLCVDLLIINDKKCLLLRRDNEPAKGQYWFPGGRVQKNESLESATRRIAKSETNIVCSFNKVISIEETMFPKLPDMTCDVHTVNICCEMTPHNAECLEIDMLHNGFMWVREIPDYLHVAVKNPLKLIGFK